MEIEGRSRREGRKGKKGKKGGYKSTRTKKKKKVGPCWLLRGNKNATTIGQKLTIKGICKIGGKREKTKGWVVVGKQEEVEVEEEEGV